MRNFDLYIFAHNSKLILPHRASLAGVGSQLSLPLSSILFFTLSHMTTLGVSGTFINVQAVSTSLEPIVSILFLKGLSFSTTWDAQDMCSTYPGEQTSGYILPQISNEFYVTNGNSSSNYLISFHPKN